jgi:hypothetical protein
MLEVVSWSRRLAGALAALGIAGSGLVLAGGSPAAPVLGARASCVPARGSVHVLADDGLVAVYSTGGKVYGCSSRTGHRTLLGNTGSCVRAKQVGVVAVAGVLGAYASESCGVDTGRTLVVVRRLTDGHQLSSEPSTTGALGAESYQSVGSLVVKRDGSVAWIGSWQSLASIGNKPAVQVHRFQRGHLSLLDSGSAIAVRSLALRGSRLSWKHGRATRTSTLS